MRAVVPVRQFLGSADAGDDVLYMLDGDGHRASGFQFVEEFGYALLDVIGYFLAVLLVAKRGV